MYEEEFGIAAAATAQTNYAGLVKLANSLDITYYFFCACLVFFMQIGFAMLEVGCVSSKNIKNIILKGTLDIAIGALIWWAVGFAVAFGGDDKFIGGEEHFFGNCLGGEASCEISNTYHFWFFQFAFAATAATIVSGAVAERCTILMYITYSIVLTAFVYPVVVHWQWGGGFTFQEFAVDYAGSGVVHMTGGLAGIIGAAIIGPRRGRFEGSICKATTNEMPSYSIVFQTLGTLILWYGWYGFNVGSTLGIVWVGSSAGVSGSEAGLVMLNTTLAPASAAVTCLVLGLISSKIRTGKAIFYLEPVLNGILAGLVSITAGCGDVRPWAALLLGIGGGIVYTATSKLQKKLKIDDVVDAGPVHFWCGIWGVLGLALFADKEDTGLTGADNDDFTYGIFYGSGKLFGANLLLVVSVIAWVSATMIPLFGIMKLLGLARVSAETEEAGLDRSEHGVKDEDL